MIVWRVDRVYTPLEIYNIYMYIFPNIYIYVYIWQYIYYIFPIYIYIFLFWRLSLPAWRVLGARKPKPTKHAQHISDVEGTPIPEKWGRKRISV